MSILSMAALAPLVVDLPRTPPDSSMTSFTVAAGGGSYVDVSRGCEGQVLRADQRRFRDLGFGVNHRFSRPLEAGVRATVLRRMVGYKDGSMMWNPYASLELHRFGFGLGYVTNADRPNSDEFDIWPMSGHLRIGRLDGFHFSIHALEDVPIVSGGGTVRAGFGFRPIRTVHLWLGSGGGTPYDRGGFLAKATFHVNRMLDLNAAGRLGRSAGESENGGSVGVTVRFTHDRTPGSAAAVPPSIKVVPDASAADSSRN